MGRDRLYRQSARFNSRHCGHTRRSLLRSDADAELLPLVERRPAEAMRARLMPMRSALFNARPSVQPRITGLSMSFCPS